jgi:hypothetical protein
MSQQPSSSRIDLLPDRRSARRPRGLLRTRRTAVLVAALLAALAVNVSHPDLGNQSHTG